MLYYVSFKRVKKMSTEVLVDTVSTTTDSCQMVDRNNTASNSRRQV